MDNGKKHQKKLSKGDSFVQLMMDCMMSEERASNISNARNRKTPLKAYPSSLCRCLFLQSPSGPLHITTGHIITKSIRTDINPTRRLTDYCSSTVLYNITTSSSDHRAILNSFSTTLWYKIKHHGGE
jgi:hypothetical protein